MAKSKPDEILIDDFQTKGGAIYTDAVEVNILGKSPLARMGISPTLYVQRPPSTPLDLTGFSCVNFSGAGAYVLQADTILVNTGLTLLLFNSSGFGSVRLSLDNGGLIGGLSTYVLLTGQFVEFQFDDGTNLT